MNNMYGNLEKGQRYLQSSSLQGVCVHGPVELAISNPRTADRLNF